MKIFLDGLVSLLLYFKVVNAVENKYAPLIFSVGCAIIGILAVFADLSFYMLKRESLFSLKHNLKNTSLFLIAWALGAAILGYVGQMLNIFQVSLLSCATVGISWPIILTKILNNIRLNNEFQNTTSEE